MDCLVLPFFFCPCFLLVKRLFLSGSCREAPSLGQIRSLPEQAAAIPNSITEPTQQHTVADLSPITPKHQAQDRLSALTASVSDIARAAASLDLGELSADHDRMHQRLVAFA